MVQVNAFVSFSQAFAYIRQHHRPDGILWSRRHIHLTWHISIYEILFYDTICDDVPVQTSPSVTLEQYGTAFAFLPRSVHDIQTITENFSFQRICQKWWILLYRSACQCVKYRLQESAGDSVRNHHTVFASFSIDLTYLARGLHHGLMAAVGVHHFFRADAVIPPQAAVLVPFAVLDGHVAAHLEWGLDLAAMNPVGVSQVGVCQCVVVFDFFWY